MSNTPDYALWYHERWEAYLHKCEQLRALKGLPVATLSERAAIVDHFVQGAPKTHSDIVSCDVCQEKISQAILEGRDPWAITIPIRTHLESLGLGKYIPGTRENSIYKKQLIILERQRRDEANQPQSR